MVLDVFFLFQISFLQIQVSSRMSSTIMLTIILALIISNERLIVVANESSSVAHCEYMRGKFACANGTISCQAHLNFSTGLNATQFGISRLPQQERLILPELIKFYLHPKQSDGQYGHYIVQKEYSFHRMSIYYAAEMFDDGVRISDLDCYKLLVKLFREALEVRVGEVRLIGFVDLVSGKLSSKTTTTIRPVDQKSTRNSKEPKKQMITNKSKFVEIFL